MEVNGKPRIGLVASVLMLAALACGRATSAPGADPTSMVLTTAVTTADPSALWMRTAGGLKTDQAWAVVTDAQANLYWGTHQQSVGKYYTDMVIYKYAPDGRLLWERRWGEDFQEKLFILAVSPPYLLVGGEQDHSINVARADMVVLALDLQDGSVAWEFTFDQGFGYEEGDGLVADGDYIYISGWTTSEQNSNDVGLIKLDRNGNQIWFSGWGGPGWDEADGQMVVDDQYIYVTGRYDSTSVISGGHGLLVKFRKDTGEVVHHLVWNDTQFYDGYGLASDGTDLYVVGMTIVPKPGTLGNGQIFVQKWDTDFNLIWERQWGGPGGDSARSIMIDDAGRIIICGNTVTQGGGKDIVLLVYDRDGRLLAEPIWGGPKDDTVQGLWVDGEYAYLTGQTTSFGAGQTDALLLKVHIPSATFPPTP